MRFNEFKVELSEVSMAPNNLSKMASAIDATCGIEFEMYVPKDLENEYQDEFESEQDLSENDYMTDSGWHDQLMDFFTQDGANSRGEITRVITKIDDRFKIGRAHV